MMTVNIFTTSLVSVAIVAISTADQLPVVVTTWAVSGFETATDKAFDALLDSGSRLNAVEAGCSFCEDDRCDGSVGFGGSPDELGETTLDAMIMDGETMDVGGIGQLRGVRHAIRTARAVMEKTTHTYLVGDAAANFAVEMGIPRQSTETPESTARWKQWKAGNCQPNFWKAGTVDPDPTKSCGPYKPLGSRNIRNGTKYRQWAKLGDHDTIAQAVIDSDGKIASGTSTNGASYKVHGRVGDSPVAGAGSYARSGDGGCGATGDGDVMVRFLPCYQAVENMARGMSPRDAAVDAIGRITRFYPTFGGAIVVVNARGEHSAACSPGLGKSWRYSYRSGSMQEHAVAEVECNSLQG
eukprot:m.9217 g.9217  ORF g.9217 m.9217 type:complete len:354 (+) comp4025_c0_seq1:94-1155(+)